MLHKEMFGLAILFFFLWVMFTTNASERIEHVCAPVGWFGNVVTTGTGLIMPGHQQQVQGVFDNTAYGCKFVVWRLFYQDAYNKFLDSQQNRSSVPPLNGAPSPAAAPPSEDLAPAPAPTAVSEAPPAPAPVAPVAGDARVPNPLQGN